MKLLRRAGVMLLVMVLILGTFTVPALAGTTFSKGTIDGKLFFDITYDGSGTVKYVILKSDKVQPTNTQVDALQDADGNSVSTPYSGSVASEAGVKTVLPIDFAALVPNIYNIYAVCNYGLGNISPVTWLNFDGSSFEIKEQLTFTVNDGTNPIEGAAVKVGSVTQTTDASGNAVFTLSGGDYSYLVQKSGFKGVSGSFTTDKQTDTKTVSLTSGTDGEYSMVLNVKDDKGTNLKNAKVTIESVTKTADSSGNVEFFLTPGTYSYSASAMGRITKSGSITVNNENTSGNVVLDTDPDGADLVINSHQQGKIGTEISSLLSANSLSAGAVRSLTVHGGVMDSKDFRGIDGDPTCIKDLFKDANIFTSVDLSDTSLDGNRLPDGAFYKAEHLASIKLPDSVTEIGETAFADCALTSFTFPDNVTKIGNMIFEDCGSLEAVTFPAGVTNIGEYLFSYGPDYYGLAPVKDVYMSSSNPTGITVNSNSFFNGGNIAVHVSDGSLAAYKNDTRDGSTTDGKWYGMFLVDPDAASPVIKAISVGKGLSGTYFTFLSDSPGQFYYAVVNDGAAAPDIDTSGSGTSVDSSMEGYKDISSPATAKDIYIVQKGINEKLSNIIKMDLPAADAAPVDITITGHTEGNIAEEINTELIKAGMGYNYDKVGSLTVNGGTVSSDDAEFINDNADSLSAVDFSGTSFEANTVPYEFLDYSETLKTIILPGNVEAIDTYAFYELDALESITLGSSTPPTLGDDVFDTVPSDAVVYVPTGSKAAYLAVDDGNTTDSKWYGLTVVEYYPKKTLTDSGTGISVTGSISDGASLHVSQLDSGSDAYKTFKVALSGGQDIIFSYEISLSASGSDPYNGSLTLALPVGAQYNGQTLTLLHNTGSSIERYTGVVANGILTIRVNSLSPFAVVKSTGGGSSATTTVTPGNLTLHVGGRAVLTPVVPGGTWVWDNAFLTLIKNSDGSATIRALKSGSTTVTYTIGYAQAQIPVTVEPRIMPQTGQDFTLMFVLLACACCVGAVVVLYRKRKVKA